MSLDDLARQIEAGEVQEIPVIVKADVQGSAEAVKSSLEKLDVQGVKVNVIRSTAGTISESDVMLASASKAVIYGFNVRPTPTCVKGGRRRRRDPSAQHYLQSHGGNGTGDEGPLAPVYEGRHRSGGSPPDLQVSKIGTIAGCMVTDGKLAGTARYV